MAQFQLGHHHNKIPLNARVSDYDKVSADVLYSTQWGWYGNSHLSRVRGLKSIKVVTISEIIYLRVILAAKSK